MSTSKPPEPPYKQSTSFVVGFISTLFLLFVFSQSSRTQLQTLPPPPHSAEYSPPSGFLASWGRAPPWEVPEDAPVVSWRETGVVEDMVPIPRGSFEMGWIDEYSEGPLPRVTLSGYYMDRNLVTVEDYEHCVAAGGCSSPPSVHDQDACNWWQDHREKHPINCVERYHAIAFCTWRDARLPTEAEWEYAARGSDGRLFPWGNDLPDHTRANACDPLCAAFLEPTWGKALKPLYEQSDGWPTTSPVGSYPAGASAFGLLDMSGNVREWVSDWWGDTPPSGDLLDPQGPPDGLFGVQRGGAWYEFSFGGLSAVGGSRYHTGNWDSVIGFRCARDGWD